MAITKQIQPADDQALIQIILDYIRGHSFEETTLRLKEQCTKFDIDCKTRYQAITHDEKAIENILNELSVGGCQLHIMSVESAKNGGKINCYVWDNQTLTYLQSGKADKIITLKDNGPLIRLINALTFENDAKTFYLYSKQIEEVITLNSDPAHTPHTTDSAQIQHYKSSQNLYDLLKKLDIKHPRLSILIDTIDKVKPAQDWWLYLMVAAVMAAATGLVVYLKENFSVVKAWYEKTAPIVSRLLHNTVYMLRKTPLLGILFLGVPLIQSWYQAIFNGTISDTNKLIRLLFKTVINTLPMIGYLLCYFAAGVMTVPAVALFITSAVLDVIETLYTLLYHEIERYFNPLAPATEYHSASIKACADNTHERNLYIFMVKFSANLLATASVVIWCVFPPSLVIALTCLTFSSLVALAKGSLVSNIKNGYAIALQSELKDICIQYTPPSHAKADIENKTLKQQNRELNEKYVQLTSKLDAITEVRNKDHKQWMGFFKKYAPARKDAKDAKDDKTHDIRYNSSP